MKRRLGDGFLLKIRHVRQVISKSTDLKPVESFGDLAAWIKQKRIVPKDIDEPICIAFSQSPGNGKFNAVFSTVCLLQQANQDVWVWMGHKKTLVVIY